jgi:glycosyltransferase involved in cell wall biosynthesis
MSSRNVRAKHIDVWHNILWSKYKGAVFSQLHDLARDTQLHFKFFQIATTEDDRIGLANVDVSYHDYPYTLVFDDSYDAIPLWRRISALLKRVSWSSADLVLIPGYHKVEYWVMLFMARMLGKRCGVFCDSTSHDRAPAKLKSGLKRIFFALCSVVFCYGQRSAEYVSGFGVPNRKIVLRCQAAALPHDYTPASALALRIVRRSRRNSPRFLYVGRLAVEKDLDTLIRALSLIHRRNRSRGLDLAGDGPLRNELLALVQAHGLEELVSFRGSLGVSELREAYAEAACLVLPSKSEPWGLVVNEALSYGCPVVVSQNCGCVPELVKSGITGFAFRTGDHVDLARAMEAALERFTDVEKTATRCLDLIGQFTPLRAAEQIYAGCDAVLTER